MHTIPSARGAAATLVVSLAALAAFVAAQDPSAPAAAPDRTAIDVRVDPRVELTSTVFRLAGSPEYSMAKVAGYADAVDAHFAPFREHAVVQRARRLRTERGVGFDAVASFAVHLDRDDPLAEHTFEPLPERLERRWSGAEAAAFHADLRRFAVDSKALEFFATQTPLYRDAEAAMRATLAQHADLVWFDRFFGVRAAARFRLVLGLLNGGSNYGPSVLAADGTEDLYCVLGCWQTDGDGKPVFGRTVVSTVAHEFCHSYCNPLVDRHLDALATAGARLFALTEDAMRAQAYANPRTLLCESLVRACVVRYVATTQGERDAAAEVAAQQRRSFLWVGDLAALLADYERARERYPDLDAFAPRLVEFFDGAAARTAELLARRPKIVAMQPANGARDVDPATSAIVLTFDRAMLDRSWSVVGGGEPFPKLAGEPSYDRERKVLTIPVALQPDHDYELWLNSERFQGFKSADGEPMAPVRVRFRTRGE